MMNNASKKNWRLAAPVIIIFAGVSWGIIGLFSKPLSSSGFDSLQITELRCLVTAAALIIFLLIVNRRLLIINLRDIWIFLGTGLLSIAFFNISYFICMKESTLSVACTLLYTGPCFVMLMSCIFFHEKFTVQKLTAIILALLGCAFTTGLIGSGGVRITFYAIVSGLCSGFGYSLYSIIGRIALKKYSWLTVITYTFTVAAIVLLPICKPAHMFDLAISSSSIIFNILMLGVLSTTLPFLLYTKGLEHMETGRASLLTFVEPVIATIISAAVFHELFGFNNVVGIVLIVISIMILNLNLPFPKSKTTKL